MLPSAIIALRCWRHESVGPHVRLGAACDRARVDCSRYSPARTGAGGTNHQSRDGAAAHGHLMTVGERSPNSIPIGGERLAA